MVLLVGTLVFAQSSEEVARARITTLDSLITVAEQAGIDALKEKMTIRTAEVFLDYADWDEANVQENTDYFDLVAAYRDNAAQMAADLPEYERSEVVVMLDTAIAYITRLIKGEIIRKPAPHVDWEQVSHDGDQLTFNNRPVFLADYTWKPEDERLEEYFGALDGFFLTPSYVTDETGTIRSWIISDLNSKPGGTMGFIFLNHKNPPQWAQDKYGPDFNLGKALRYTEYDIDDPGAREMQQLLLSGTVPRMAGKQYTQLGYMLCNEPHFFTSIDGDKELWASGGVSSFTMDKFRTWLQEKHDSISVLNTLWGTDFSAFDSVLLAIPIDIALRGTNRWYDWVSFNNHRVTGWYTFMKEEIQKHDTTAKVHLKIMPHLWSENTRNHGIDFEALSEMSEILGNDAGSENSRMWGELPWADHYALKWRDMFMGYDFLKSVGPEKIIFNSESHFLSTGKFRDLYLDPAYVRCIFWAAHMQGLNASQIWYWPRLEDGSIKSNAGKGYAGSNIQQPRVTNEVHSTMMDLNTFSEEITAIQRLRKPIRIFHSETSAIVKEEHMDDEFELYEALSFEGIPLGFTTQNIISNQDHGLWEMVLVFKTEYVTPAELEALQAYLDRGGTVIIDQVSLKMDEYGRQLGGVDQGNGSLIVTGSLSEMKDKALEIIEERELSPMVSVSEWNSGGSKGCHWRCIRNDSGQVVLSVVNIGKTDARLQIELKDASGRPACKDLLTGVPVSAEPVLKPYDVFFVEVLEQADTSHLGSREHQLDLNGVLYPNPSAGAFNISFPQIVEQLDLNVYNMMGESILSTQYRNVRSITEEIREHPDGIYAITARSGSRFQTFMLVK